jgi:hypothetical protein
VRTAFRGERKAVLGMSAAGGASPGFGSGTVMRKRLISRVSLGEIEGGAENRFFLDRCFFDKEDATGRVTSNFAVR